MEQEKTHEASQELLVKELEEVKARLAYLMAEFDNYKKRTEKERISWVENRQKEILEDLLPIVDDFDRALAHSGNQEEKNLRNGLELTHKSLLKLLTAYSVEELPAQKEFDPEKHEALLTVESAEHSSGEIVAILQKGYLYKNSVLRPAKVSVAQ